MTILLCDAGGTHARFSLSMDGKAITPPQKIKAADFPTIGQAIRHFLHAQEIDPSTIDSFRLAYGGRNPWETTKDAIKDTLPEADFVKLNDFEANAYGISALPDQGEGSDETVLLNRPGRGRGEVGNKARLVAGIGTGLGLAYVFETPSGRYVHPTHGGHMLPACAQGTPHGELIASLAARRDQATAPIYEDIVSGPGLFALYRLLQERTHTHPDYRDANDLIDRGQGDPIAQQALKILHEMLGVFLHQAVLFGGAYGGIYLTGGIIDRLVGKGLFDMETVGNFMDQDNVPVVRQDVASVPVFWVRDEFIALKGLLEL